HDLQSDASQPVYVSLEALADAYDFAFLALHGRPGEDGDLQSRLEQLGLPFNGSASSSAQLSMNKYATNEKLREAGLLAPRHTLVERSRWEADSTSVLDQLEADFGYPLIGKPVDDGCSSAVRKIDSRDELRAFIEAIFRDDDIVAEHLQKALQISPKEEFPIKNVLLFEELIRPNGADRFLEITVGFQTHTFQGERQYHVLPPSEALAGAGILSLEEKFLAGQGQNITPARFSNDPDRQALIDEKVREAMEQAARAVDASGYGRIDAFVRVYEKRDPEVIFIEVNSLPGMTPATCIFHQAALEDMTPAQFIQAIIREGMARFD
ncbi:MAG: D-alanine--D-alanine ligase family protein, partial [Bacteroidota bacterium]